MLYPILFVCYASYAFNRKSVAYSVAGLIEDGLDTEHAGVIASSQNAAFAISKFAAGLLSDRLEPRLLFAGGMLASALAALSFSFASHPAALAAIWFLNGLAQGCAWPACAKILRQRASPSQFGTLWSILASSNNVSGSLGPIVSAFIIVRYGWRWNVFFAGFVTLILCFVFLLSLPFLPHAPKAQVEKASNKTALGSALSDLFRDPFVWLLSVCFLVVFCARTTTVDWGQLYLKEEMGHNQYVASAFTSSVEVGGFVGRILAGYWTDWIVARDARKRVPSEGGKSGLRLSVAAIFLVGSALSVGLFRFAISEQSSFMWITGVGTLMGSCFYGPIAIFGIVSSESFPPHLSGSSHAIVALFGNGKQPRRKAAAKGHQLPEPIPEGKEITDTQKKTWIISKVIGSGGFGTVYFAAEKNKPKELNYVVKVEYHQNGPLFAEMHCYQKIAKPAILSDWVKKMKLDYLGISPGHGFGSFEHNGSKYRFMVLERYDKDLQKLLDENGRRFPLKTVCLIGLSVIDVLEYIHSCGYVHGDVKAANLLTGYRKGTENQVYLVDMGLACKYINDGVHKKDVPDPKKAHNGTPEFTSRDAHRGSFSRRSDLEILAYNLLQWISGRLPWEDFISDNNKLQKEKERYMSNIGEFLKVMFPEEKCPSGISKFLQYVTSLSFEEEPNYSHCKKLLKDDLKSIGCANDNKLEFSKMKKKPTKATDTPVSSAPEQVSDKENGKKPKTAKRTQTKRKVPEEIKFEEGMVLTPAMQEILNNKKTKDAKPNTRRKLK